MQVICVNRKAVFEFHILEKYCAGLVLEGCEVKSIRMKKCSIAQAYISFQHEKPVIYGMHIDLYKQSFEKYDEKKVRNLLLNKKEIRKIMGRLNQGNYTLIPLKVFIANTGFVKIEFGFCEGKKKFDKRAAIKEREWNLQKTRLNRKVF